MPIDRPSSDHAEAIRRVQEGDVEAFTVLVHDFQRPLRTWVARYCPSGIDPDEIAQRAFIAGFRSIHRFEGESLLPWLCAIARHELLGELKRSRRDPARANGALAGLAEIERSEAESDLAAAELGERRALALRACMARLQGAAVDLLQRRYQQEEPIASIANGLGISIDAVKSRLHWLRGRLHDCVNARLAAEQA